MNVANVLILLSRGGCDGEEIVDVSARTSPAGRVFECKTCNRRFPSFQALGGHRASHKKPRVAGNVREELARARVHECSVCGLEFAVGQALGGHMRRHRAAADSFPQGSCLQEKKPREEKALWLDLNAPPSEGERDYRKKIFGFEMSPPWTQPLPKKGAGGRRGGSPKKKRVSRSVEDGIQFPDGRVGLSFM
ncbi:hypothetical protein GW17_00059096 [Ensete ventricosum]|nr:hypothetical protein GW17_00059096 [Ensete ventricosum]